MATSARAIAAPSADAPAKVMYTAGKEAGDHAFEQGFRRLQWLLMGLLVAMMLMGAGITLSIGHNFLAMAVVDGIAALLFAFVWLGDKTPLSGTSWLRGYFGERVMFQLLGMLPESYRVFHDIQVESNGKKSNIDHLVIAPNGIWLIETKNWQGTFSAVGGRLMLNGRERMDVVNSTVARATELRRELERVVPTVPFVRALVVSVSARVPNGKLDIGHATIVGASDVVPLIRPGSQRWSSADIDAACAVIAAPA